MYHVFIPVGVINAGSQLFIQANSEDDMFQWIKSLNEACRITVSHEKKFFFYEIFMLSWGFFRIENKNVHLIHLQLRFEMVMTNIHWLKFRSQLSAYLEGGTRRGGGKQCRAIVCQSVCMICIHYSIDGKTTSFKF